MDNPLINYKVKDNLLLNEDHEDIENIIKAEVKEKQLNQNKDNNE